MKVIPVATLEEILTPFTLPLPVDSLNIAGIMLGHNEGEAYVRLIVHYEIKNRTALKFFGLALACRSNPLRTYDTLSDAVSIVEPNGWTVWSLFDNLVAYERPLLISQIQGMLEIIYCHLKISCSALDPYNPFTQSICEGKVKLP